MKTNVVNVLLYTLISIFFIGCTAEKQIVFQDKLVCIEQSKLTRLKVADIRVQDEDVEVYKEYVNSTNSQFEFYENQVDRNNNLCKEIEKLESEGK